MISAANRRYTIDNLQPKTFYYVRAKAQNLAGYSDPSNTIYLQTSAPHSGDLLDRLSTLFSQLM
jgi:hypothetical protein